MFGDWSLFTTFLYVLGLVLLLIEGMLPGFGIAGITGLVLIITCIVLITNSVFQALLLVIATIAIVFLVLIVLYKLGVGGKYLKYVVLGTEQKNEEGYKSTEDYSDFLGKKGTVITTLRPSGMVDIDGQKVDVVSEGDFIEKGQNVIVTKIEGSRIIVKKIN